MGRVSRKRLDCRVLSVDAEPQNAFSMHSYALIRDNCVQYIRYDDMSVKEGMCPPDTVIDQSSGAPFQLEHSG